MSKVQDFAEDLVQENRSVRAALAVADGMLKNPQVPNRLFWEQVRSVLADMQGRGQKSLPDETPDEPLGAQALRRVHQDAMTLLEEYDSWLSQLEHDGVKSHLEEQLERLETAMTETEKVFRQAYADLDPLEGEMPEEDDGDESEIVAKYGGKSFELPDRYGYQDHHRKRIAKACEHLKALARKDRLSDTDRLESYHHSRYLDGVVDDANSTGELGGKSVGYDNTDDVNQLQRASKFLKEMAQARYSDQNRATDHAAALDDLNDEEKLGQKSLRQLDQRIDRMSNALAHVNGYMKSFGV